MSMFKRSVKTVLGRMGYELARRDRSPRRPEPPPPETPPPCPAPAPDETERLRKELDQVRAELGACRRDYDGYKNAYETVAAELGQCRQDRDGYKNAYDAVSTELSDTRVVLRQFTPDPDLVREAALLDAPPRHRLGDNPELLAEMRADVARLGLPDDAARLLCDPDFSIEDRNKYHGVIRALLERYDMWDAAGGIVSKIITAQYHRYQPRSADSDLACQRAETLRRDGIVHLGKLLSPQQIAEVQRFFLDRPIFNGHVPTSAKHRVLRRYVGYTADQYPLGCYPIADIALAPHLLEMALQPMILDTAAAYFGCTPTLTWMQCWWNFVGQGKYVHLQNNHHRDENDLRMFWVYMYLTDVNEGEGSGPHAVLRRSADFNLLRDSFEKAKGDPRFAERFRDLTFQDFCSAGHRLSDELKEALFPGQTETVYGPAGTVFITKGIDYHKVVTPIRKRRCLFAARFCMNELAYPGPDRDGDPIPGEVAARRVGDDALIRHVTRLRFDWGGARFPEARDREDR
jgi:hypothetical protein